jgi:hypothetical protein
MTNTNQILEIWKDIPNYEGLYQASNIGNIKRMSRIIKNQGKYSFMCKEKVLKTHLVREYQAVNLWIGGKIKSRTVHQLVAEAFLGHVPCGLKLVINHKNFIKTDNRVENLEIVTARENASKTSRICASKYTGVTKSGNMFCARIVVKGKIVYLGSFRSEDEAGAYYKSALEAHLSGKSIVVKKPVFTSVYTGVTFVKNTGKWSSRIKINKKSITLGYFKTEIEAYERYKEAKEKLQKM